MNAVLVFVVGVLALQSANAQCIRSPVMATTPIIQTNNVGATLADTLSLLTVSSLLAEKLPFEYPCIGPIAPYSPIAPCAPFAPIAPITPIAPIAPVVNNCGCGNYGYPYNTYVL